LFYYTRTFSCIGTWWLIKNHTSIIIKQQYDNMDSDKDFKRNEDTQTEEAPEIRSWASARKPAEHQLLDDTNSSTNKGFLIQRRKADQTVLSSTSRLLASVFAFKTLPWVSQYAIKRGGALPLIDASLRGIGQVFFCNSPLSGITFLVAVFVSNPLMAALLILGVFSATAFAKIMDYDPGLLASGIWGYNGALLGCALSVFTLGGNEVSSTILMLMFGVIGGGCMTVVFTSAAARILVPQGITPLTFPFQLVTWMWLLGTQQWSHVTAIHSPIPSLQIHVNNGTASTKPFQAQIYEPTSVVKAAFSGIAQTFLVPEWYCGLIMLFGISFCSLISAIWALLGSLVGCIVAMGLGVTPKAIYGGLHGYNSCLCGMAIGGFFLVQHGYKVSVVALIGIIAAEIMTASTSSAFSPFGIPALTWPFTIITWVLILSTAGLPSIVAVAIDSLTTAEDHRSRFLLSKSITSHFSLLAQFAAVHPASTPEDIARIEANLLPITLCAVAAAGKVKELKRLLSFGASVEACDYDGRTALHLASAEFHTDVVRLLLERGADVNALDYFGGTPLEDAVRSTPTPQSIKNRQEAVISLLLNNGASLNAASTRLLVGPQLCQAAADGNIESLRVLLRAGCSPASFDYDLRTPLHLAAAGSHENTDMLAMNMLVQYGGSQLLHRRDRFGNTPLDDAKRHDFKAGAQWMEDYLFRFGSENEEAVVDLVTLNGQPVRKHQASLSDEQEFVSTVLDSIAIKIADSSGSEISTDKNASPTLSISKNSKNDMPDFLLPSLLCCAAAKGDKKFVEKVLDEMPASAVNVADYDSRTPLHIAVEQGRIDVVKLLLSRGADAAIQDRWGISPLWSAVLVSNEPMVRILRERLAQGPLTALSTVATYLCKVASQPENEDTMHSLTVAIDAAGFDPNASDYDGRTALHIAASCGNRAIYDLLVKFGANTDARDRWGNAPLMKIKK
jgi:urea transporter